MRITTRVDLDLLGTELTTAAVPFTFLGLSGPLPDDPDAQELFTYDAGGEPVELPPEAAPVVAAHVPPPLVVAYVEEREIATVTRTTDGTMRELYRVPCAVMHVYDGALVMRAVDAGNGAVKVSRAELTFKRGATAVVQQVGTTTVTATRADAGTTGWAIQAQAQGTDLVIGVRGEAGRTIDWHLAGVLAVFAPDGL